jgi:hypothetical protein
MSRVSSGAAARPDGFAAAAYGDIAGAPALEHSIPVKRTDLSPAQESASLQAVVAAGPATLTPLTQYLGAALTVASPAWSRDPLPGLRALQKRLLAHSLARDPAGREDSMAAILVVEQAVHLRLRLQQMALASMAGEAAVPDGGRA